MASATTVTDARRPEPPPARRTEPPAKGHFRPDIQGLRAVAVALVVAAHVTGWPAGGFIGVDVFFVISGFLITGLLLRERARTGRISFGGFYVRRARRMLPAALVVARGHARVPRPRLRRRRVLQTVERRRSGRRCSSRTSTSPPAAPTTSQPTPAPSPLQHFWSLAVEEQFYLVWPLLLLVAFAVRLRRRRAGARTRCGCCSARSPSASFAWSLHATAPPAGVLLHLHPRLGAGGRRRCVAVSATRLHRLRAPLRAALAWPGSRRRPRVGVRHPRRDAVPGQRRALPVLGTAAAPGLGGAPGGPRARWRAGQRAGRLRRAPSRTRCTCGTGPWWSSPACC